MKNLLFTGFISLFLSCNACGQQVEKEFVYTGNPIVRDIYTADPSAHVWTIDGKERLYVYPSHDIDPPSGCDRMDKYHVYSTDDMVHWTDHGQILEASQVSWGVPITNASSGATFMWAPDCAYRNGKYYFYFPHPYGPTWNDTWRIGIAVSDEPAANFQVLSHTLIGLPDEGHIDPCVFIDDDGQAYFYYGGGNHCFGAQLKENMIELDGSLQAMTGLIDFHEGAWVFKRNGVYYLTYADNTGGANQLRYATGDNPLGPWSYKGVYLTSTTSDTSHGSVVEYKGQWWAFYHTADLSGTGLLRSICVDSLFFNENGTIQTVAQTKDKGTPYKGIERTAPGTIEAEDYNEGGQGIAYWDTTEGNPSLEYRREDVDISKDRRTGIVYVTNTANKEYLNYTYEVLKDGVYNIEFRIGAVSGSPAVKFYLEYDGKKLTNPYRYTVPTASVSDLATVIASNIALTKGRHTIGFYPSGNVYFDRFTFVNTATDIRDIGIHPVSVYPNPSNGVFHVQSNDKVNSVSVFDVSGKNILQGKGGDSNLKIDLSKQMPGIYFLTLLTDERMYRSKLVKNSRQL
jgi:hypothetical protein